MNHSSCRGGIPPQAQTMLRDVYLHIEAMESMSSISSTATADSLDGAGRTLGSLYTFLGRRLEGALSRCMAHLGFGPHACKCRLMKRRRALSFCDCHTPAVGERIPFPYSAEDMHYRKEIERLLKYVSSKIAANQSVALDAIVDLAIYDTYLRQLLVSLGAPRIVALEGVRAEREPGHCHLLAPSQKALISLYEVRINCLGQRTGLLYRSIWTYTRRPGEEARQLQWRDLSAFLDTVLELIQHSVQSPDCSFLALRHLGRAPLFSGFESLFDRGGYPHELRERYDRIPVALANAFLCILEDPSSHWIEWQSFGWLLWVFALYSRCLEERMFLTRVIACRSWVYLPVHIKMNLSDFGPCDGSSS